MHVILSDRSKHAEIQVQLSVEYKWVRSISFLDIYHRALRVSYCWTDIAEDSPSLQI